MLIQVYKSGGRPRADQPLFVDCAQLLAEVDWNPETELLEEAIEAAGFGMLRWVEQSGGTFYEFDENGDVEMIAEVGKMMKIQLVYVAGPYSGATREAVEANIANAVNLGLEVARLGACPVIPHSNTSHPQFEELQNYEFWIQATLALMLKCDAVVTTSNWEHSRGARGEVLAARERGIPVLHSVAELEDWISFKASLRAHRSKQRA